MLHSFKTITATEMRGVNRSAVFEIIRTQGPISRTKIASDLQVSLPTVSRVVDELIEEDLVRFNSKKESSGGRKRLLFEFNAHEHLTIGVDMRSDSLYGAIVDLAGEIILDKKITTNDLQGIAVYDLLKEFISELLEDASKTKRHIRGIGVGAPGITYYEEGIVKWSPTLDWRNFPLKQKLQETFKLPVILDNDVNLSALGEIWFGAGRGYKNLVFILIDQGIGAGIIIDGAVYRGSHLTAGEIGYLLPDASALHKEWGGVGATESFAAVPGILARAEKALNELRIINTPKKISVDAIFDSYQAGESWSKEVVDKTIDLLAQLIGAVSVFYDPDVIVISGEVVKRSGFIINTILERIGGRVPLQPKLLPSTLGSKAAIMGIVINVLHNTSDFFVIRKLE